MGAPAHDDYPHRVVAWLAARLLAGVGVPTVTGAGCGRLARIVCAQDLALVETAAGCRAAVRARRTLRLSDRPDTDFARTVHALVGHHLRAGAGRDRLVVALGPETKRPARVHLPAFLTAVARADPATPLHEVPMRAGARHVGGQFLQQAETAWRELTGAGPTADDLRRFVKRTVVVVLDVDGEGPQAVEGRSLVGQLVRDPRQAAAAWEVLVARARHLAEQGQGCDRRSLQQQVIPAGVELRTPPDFRRDVARLTRVTATTSHSLAERSAIPSRDGPVTLDRPVVDVLERRLDRGSTLVVGEPGAGKSVVLARLLERLAHAGTPVLALSAATTPAAGLDQLRRGLGVGGNLAQCLEQWDPQRPGVLAVDALHAAEDTELDTWHALITVASTAGWTAVAVDRLDHLRHTGFMDLFPAGPPAGSDHTLAELADVNHVHVAGLTDRELDELAAGAHEFRGLVDEAPPGLAQLLRSPFNLRLVGELFRAGADERVLRGIGSRLELLQQYSTWVATPPEQRRPRRW